jgi:hypothetical protein
MRLELWVLHQHFDQVRLRRRHILPSEQGPASGLRV